MQNLSKNLFDLLMTKDYNITTLDGQQKEETDWDKVKIFGFDFEVDGKNFGPVIILLSSAGDMEIFFGDIIGKTMNHKEKKVWSDLLYQLRMFSKRNMLGYKLEHMTHLKYSLKSMANMFECFQTIFEGYYGTRRTSYNPQGNAKIIIKHSKPIGEDDKRYRNISSIFIENDGGERFKLPFTKLPGARAMARHVTEGGNPYDIFGLHISEMVDNIGTLSGFVRRSKMFAEDENTAELVNTGRTNYDSMRKNLKTIAGKRGYHTYKESWTPSDISETDINVANIRKLFTKEAINSKVDNALPLLARLSANEPDIILDDIIPEEEVISKELTEFNDWAESIVNETENITEGTWSLPTTPDQIDELMDWFSMEQPVGIDALNVTNALYDIVGDDSLFDNLGDLASEDPEADARFVVKNWIHDFIRRYPTHAASKLLSTNLVRMDTDDLQEDKDLDSDETCSVPAADEKITNKGNGMNTFKDYVQEEEKETLPKEKETTPSTDTLYEVDQDFNSLIQRTNYLLQK